MARRPPPLPPALHADQRQRLNLVERWFGELTARKLRRGVHRSVKELNADIENWTDRWNEQPKPYVWVKTADEILDNLAGYCNAINASGH